MSSTDFNRNNLIKYHWVLPNYNYGRYERLFYNLFALSYSFYSTIWNCNNKVDILLSCNILFV